IHMGRVAGAADPVLEIGGRREGCRSADGWVVGTSVHGLLAAPALRRGLVEALAARRGAVLPPPAPPAPDPYDRLADALEACLDVPLLDRLVFAAAGAGRAGR